MVESIIKHYLLMVLFIIVTTSLNTSLILLDNSSQDIVVYEHIPIHSYNSGNNTIIVPIDYQSLQEAIDNASPGSKIIVLYGRYYNVKIKGKSNLTIDGLGNSSIQGLRVAYSVNITIKNINISSHYSRLIPVELATDSKNIVYINTTMIYYYKACIKDSQMVKIVNSIFQKVYKIIIKSSSDVVIRDNVFKPNHSFIYTYDVEGLYIENVLGNPIELSIDYSKNIVIDEAIVSFINIFSSLNTTISNTILLSKESPSIGVYNTKRVYITRCSNGGNISDIQIMWSQDIVVDSCNLSYIEIMSSLNISLCNNLIVSSKPHFYLGISILDTADVRIENNVLKNAYVRVYSKYRIDLESLEIINTTVDGKPVVLVKNIDLDGRDLREYIGFIDFSELIMYNVSNTVIRDYVFTNKLLAIALFYSHNIVFRNCMFENIVIPIDSVSSSNVILTNCTLVYTTYLLGGIDIRSYYLTYSNYTLENCLISNTPKLYFTYSLIKNSRFINTTLSLLYTYLVFNKVYNSLVFVDSRSVVDYNVFDNSSVMVLALKTIDIVFTNNYFIKKPPYIASAKSGFFANNSFEGRDIVVLSNTDLEDKAFSNVSIVVVDNVSNMVIEDSIIDRDGLFIAIYNSKGIVLRNIVFSNLSGYNLVVSSSNNIVVEDCTFTNNFYGVVVKDSREVYIVHNMFYNNTIGVFVEQLFSNVEIYIYGNSFINNTINIGFGGPNENTSGVKLYSLNKVYYYYNGSFVYYYLGNYWGDINYTNILVGYGVYNNSYYTISRLNHTYSLKEAVFEDKYPLVEPHWRYRLYSLKPPYFHTIIVNKKNGFIEENAYVRIYVSNPLELVVYIRDLDNGLEYLLGNYTLNETGKHVIKLDVSRFSDGEYELLFKLACIGYEYSSKTYVKIDNNKPYLEIVKPTNNSVLPNKFNLYIIYNDTFLDKAVIVVKGISNSYYKKVIAKGFKTTLDLPNGEYIIYVTVYDKVGHNITKSLIVKVEGIESSSTTLIESTVSNQGVSLTCLLIIVIIVLSIVTVYYKQKR